MKLNNFTIINLLNVLNNYSNSKLPQKISFAITKNLMILNKEYQTYEEHLKKVIANYNEYIEADENGNITLGVNGLPKINDATQEYHFNEDINELLLIELDVDLYQIDEEVFNYDDSDKYSSLTPTEIMQLQSILCNKE